MARLRLDFAGGLLSQDAQPTDGTLVSPSFQALPQIAAPDYMPIILDPGGTPEVSWIIGHNPNSASVTVTRQAEQGTTNPAQLHQAGKGWVQGPTVADFDGRLLVATSTTLPSSPDPGTTVACTDTLAVVTYLQGAWQTVGGVPVGVIMAYAGEVAAGGSITPPNGYLFCNGQAVTSAAYPALYNLLSTAGNPYGVDGSNNPLVPDLRNRRIAGAGGNYATGATGGHDTYTFGVSDMPNHTHPITDKTHAHTVTDNQHRHNMASSAGGVSPGYFGVTWSGSTEWLTSSGTAGTRMTGTVPGGVYTNYSKANIAINGANTGITATNGVSGWSSQTAVDMRSPYLAAPFIIKAT